MFLPLPGFSSRYAAILLVLNATVTPRQSLGCAMAIAAGIHVGRQGCWLLLVAVLLGVSTASGHKGHSEHCPYCQFKRISTYCNEQADWQHWD